MTNYTLGHELAMNIIVVLIVLLLILSIGVVKLGVEKKGILKGSLVGFFVFIIIPICAYLVFFPVIFSSINLLNQDVLNVSFWKEEISTGVFAIRIASLVLTIKFIVTLIALVKQNNVFEKRLEVDCANETELINNIEKLSLEQADLLIKKDLLFLSMLQFAFYLACVSSLWVCTLNGESSIIVMLTSWSLFYIIDDWTVMSEYSQKYRVMPLNAHKKKIFCFNGLLFVGSCVSLAMSEYWLEALFMCVSLFLFGTALGMYYSRASKVVEKFA